MKTNLVEVQDLAKTFEVSAPWLNRVVERKPRQFVHAVDGVSFDIARGRTVALVGESGCGKSTVARLLVRLYGPTRGTVRFDGQDTRAVFASAGARALHRRMQMIFQDPFASLNPRWRVADIIAEPLHAHGLKIIKIASNYKFTILSEKANPRDLREILIDLNKRLLAIADLPRLRSGAAGG